MSYRNNKEKELVLRFETPERLRQVIEGLEMAATTAKCKANDVVRNALIHELRLLKAYATGAKIYIEYPDGSRKELLHAYNSIPNGRASP